MQQKLSVDGRDWLMTCVSMGNPHAMTYGLADGTPIKVRACWGGWVGEGARSCAPASHPPPSARRRAGPLSSLTTLTALERHHPHRSQASTPSTALPPPPTQVDDLDLARIGPMFEHNPVFPARTNTGAAPWLGLGCRGGGVGMAGRCHILQNNRTAQPRGSPAHTLTHPPPHPLTRPAEFVEVLTPSHVRMHVWERGAGRTLACGTGACATVVAGVLEGKTQRTCQVRRRGSAGWDGWVGGWAPACHRAASAETSASLARPSAPAPCPPLFSGGPAGRAAAH